MTGDVNFSGKIAKKLNLSDIKVDGLSPEDKAKLDAIFNTKNDGDSKDALTIDEIVKSVANIDTDKNGKLSDKEMKAAWEKLTNRPQGITETQYISYLKAMSAANEQSAKEANIGNGYTIQLGEQLDDLVERVLKSQGVTEPTADQKSKCRQVIIDNNPNSMKIENGTVKWLIAGAKIYLPTDTQTGVAYVKDKDNKAEVEEKYRKWRSGEIASFIYKVGDDGKVYEERNGQRTLAGGGSGSGAVDEDVEAVDMSKIVLIGKITKEDCFDIHDYDKKYDFADVKAKVEKGRDILAKLNNPSSIKECKQGDEKYDNGQVKWYTITFDDDSEVKIHMSEDGNIDGMYSVDSDGNDMIGIYDDGSLWIEMEGSNNVFDVAIRGAVKDFDKVVGLVKQSDKVREAMGLPSKDFVNFDKIVDEEMPEGVSVSDFKDKVKLANQVITKLENPSEVKTVKSTDKDGGKEMTITLKDDTVVKAEVDKDGKVTKVTVQYKNSSSSDVTYDLKSGNITAKVGEEDVTTTAVINESGKKLIEKYIKSTKASDGTSTVQSSASAINITEANSVNPLHPNYYTKYSDNKALADARIERATKIIDKLQDEDNIESVEKLTYNTEINLYSITVNLKDGSSVELRVEPDGSLYGVMVDFNSKDGSSHEVGFFADGINLALTDSAEDWDIKEIGDVDMNKMKQLLPQNIIDKFKLSDDDISKMGNDLKVSKNAKVGGRPAYVYGRNYFYKDNQPLLSESVDTDAIFVIDGKKYTLSKGLYTLDYYDITGQRSGMWKDNNTIIIDSNGHFDANKIANLGIDVTLSGDGPLNGCKLTADNGNVVITYKGKKYNMNALMAGLYPEIE